MRQLRCDAIPILEIITSQHTVILHTQITHTILTVSSRKQRIPPASHHQHIFLYISTKPQMLQRQQARVEVQAAHSRVTSCATVASSGGRVAHGSGSLLEADYIVDVIVDCVGLGDVEIV
jgi:hypothetical protein